jgi:hypothetical protein
VGAVTAVCADKGSPGATTLALQLAAAHPNLPLLVEADPAGGDLAQRLFAGTGRAHPTDANLLGLASDARKGADPNTVGAHAAMTPADVRLVEGLGNADQQVGLLPLWPSLVTSLTLSGNDVVVDLGRISATHPGLAVVAAARRTLLVVRPHLEELVRLRDRARQLLAVAGGDAERLVVVVVSPDKTAQGDQNAASQVLADAGLPAIRVAWIPFKAREVAELFAGHANRRGYLWRAAAALAAELTPAVPHESSAAAHAAAGSHAGDNVAGEVAWTTS